MYQFQDVPLSGIKFEDIIFREHSLALGWRKLEKVEYRNLDLFNYISSAKSAVLKFQNGCILSIITSHSFHKNYNLFEGDAFSPTFEIRPIVEQNGSIHTKSRVTPAVLIDQINEINSQQLFLQPRNIYSSSDEEILQFLKKYPSRMKHNPEIHGSFLYREEHNFEPELLANRAYVNENEWKNYSWHEIDGIKDVNKWCFENCKDAFSWMGVGPQWCFRNYSDLFQFRLKWG